MTVALSGDGGDELFAGYERFAAGLLAGASGSLPAAAARCARARWSCCPLARCADGRQARSGSRASPSSGCPTPIGRGSPTSRIPSARRSLGWPARRLGDRGLPRAIWARSEGADTLDRLLDLNLRTYLLDDLLVKADRMSMAHGLEVRSPFLDSELLSLAARLAAAAQAARHPPQARV